MTKQEIKRLTKHVNFSFSKWGTVSIDLANNLGYNIGVKIDLIDIINLVLKKIKKGEFTISEQPKGNKHARIKLN